MSQLLQSSKDAAIDDTTTSFTNLSDNETFLKREINNTVSHIHALMRDHKLEPTPFTFSTADGTQFYDKPVAVNSINTVTMTINSMVHPLHIVESQAEWDRINQVSLTGGIPRHAFPRRDDIGFYPIPGDVYTVTITYNYSPVAMTQADYTTGTIARTISSKAIVGTGTTFTAAMVGRWLVETNSGIPSSNFYRVGTFTDTTHITVHKKVVEATGSSLTYIIGESPELPDSLHEYIPYRAAAIYYKLRRKDAKHAKELLNFFYTGDYDNERRTGKITGGVLHELRMLKERGRGNSQIVYTGGGMSQNRIQNEAWTTVLGDLS
jgi:hypothetical protein